MQVRADSAGCSARLATEFRARNIGFAVVARTNPQVKAAISRAASRRRSRGWAPALTQTGEERDGATVAELSDLIDLTGWPEGTRFVVRRARCTPVRRPASSRRWSSGSGATTPTGPTAQSQPTCTCAPTCTSRTTSAGSRPPVSSGSRSPTSTPTGPGWRWCASPQISCAGSSCCACRGPLATAEPKTLRWQLWHTPARHRSPRTTDHRAHPRRLAQRRHAARCLPTNRARRLNARTHRTPATVQTRTRPKTGQSTPPAAPNCRSQPRCRARHGHARTNPTNTTHATPYRTPPRE